MIFTKGKGLSSKPLASASTLLIALLIVVSMVQCKKDNHTKAVKAFNGLQITVWNTTGIMNTTPKYNAQDKLLLEGKTFLRVRFENTTGNGSVFDYKSFCEKTLQEKRSYVNDKIKNDMWIITQKGDSIPINYVQFDNSPKLNNYSDMIISVANEKFIKDNEFTFVWNDNLFCNGKIEFDIENT